MDKKQFIKRSADWLEKISVASVAVGLFQGEEKVLAGLVVGILAIVGSHILDTIKEEAMSGWILLGLLVIAVTVAGIVLGRKARHN